MIVSKSVVDTCQEFVRDHLVELESMVGRVSKIESVHGGLVNYVYRITGERDTVYIKLRSSEFSALPDIRIDPDDIRHESRAIELFSAAFPEVFPKQFTFDRERSLMVLSDVIGSGSTLESLLNDGRFTALQSFELGRLVGRIHAEFLGKDLSIREGGDEKYYVINLGYRLGYLKNEVIDKLLMTLAGEPRQLILGDLSPKNICVSKDGKFTICDLENVHRGNPVFDVGFLAAHLILHNLGDDQKALELVESFVRGYDSAYQYAEAELVLKQVALGIILYRVDNPVIPYNLALSGEEKRSVINSAAELLLDEKASWSSIVRRICMNPKHDDVEREVKVLNVDEKEIARRLDGLGAQKILDAVTYIEGFDFKVKTGVHKGQEIPERFQPLADELQKLSNGQTLLEQGTYLRIRQEGERSELILKIRQGGSILLKEEREISIEINPDEFEQVREILGLIGLKKIVTEEKKRISYLYPKLSLRFDIDTWPGMPTYLEVEGPDEGSIFEGVRLVGLNPKDATSASSKEIFERYGIDPTNLRFDRK